MCREHHNRLLASMLILAKSAETIFKVSQALVKHAVSACKLGLARLACHFTLSAAHINHKFQTYWVYGSLYTKTI